MQNNYREIQSSPEGLYRRKKSSGKLASFALGAVLTLGIVTGANKLIASSNIDYDSDGKSFSPNGGIPEVYFNIADYSSNKDSAGNTSYEYDNGAKKVSINFNELDDGTVLTIEKGGSFRTSPVAADVDRLSTILLSNQDLVLDKVDGIGRWTVDGSGDEFYMIEAEDAPSDVKEYISEKKIELPEIGGKEYIFISQRDADIVDVNSVASTEKAQ